METFGREIAPEGEVCEAVLAGEAGEVGVEETRIARDGQVFDLGQCGDVAQAWPVTCR